MKNSLKYGKAIYLYYCINVPDALSCETLKCISILTAAFSGLH